MSFLVYDLIFLAAFLIFFSVFLYTRKKNLKKEGLLLLYKTKWGIKLIDYIGNNGYPFTGKEAESSTKGMVTTSYLVMIAKRSGGKFVKSIGYGLYIPADKYKENMIPMSKQVAKQVAALDAQTPINDKENLRMFRIMLVAERLGWVNIRKSRSTVKSISCQTMKINWTEQGLEQIRFLVGNTNDAF